MNADVGRRQRRRRQVHVRIIASKWEARKASDEYSRKKIGEEEEGK